MSVNEQIDFEIRNRRINRYTYKKMSIYRQKLEIEEQIDKI